MFIATLLANWTIGETPEKWICSIFCLVGELLFAWGGRIKTHMLINLELAETQFHFPDSDPPFKLWQQWINLFRKNVQLTIWNWIGSCIRLSVTEVHAYLTDWMLFSIWNFLESDSIWEKALIWDDMSVTRNDIFKRWGGGFRQIKFFLKDSNNAWDALSFVTLTCLELVSSNVEFSYVPAMKDIDNCQGGKMMEQWWTEHLGSSKKRRKKMEQW